jgi:thymidylate synthase (FAD)
MLITEPKVYLIAQSYINISEFSEWAHNEVGPTPDGSPLDKMTNRRWEGMANDDMDLVEFAGRHCYASWHKGREHDEYIQNLRDQGHGSVFEHPSYTFAISGVSRNLTHELVRHRVGVAISQESQRYVAPTDNFVVPPALLEFCEGDMTHPVIKSFHDSCQSSLNESRHLSVALSHLPTKQRREAARALLPGCIETKLVWTVNRRTLEHVLDLRGSEHAEAEIRRLVEVVKEVAL